MMFTKREAKLFLTFFIIFSYFAHWVGVDENSNFDLSRAIVEEGRFEIDSYVNNTLSRSLYEGHYYTNRPPGMAFLTTAIYTAWSFAYHLLTSESGWYQEPEDLEVWHLNGILSYPRNPGLFALISMVLSVISISSLFSALTAVLIYRVTNYFTQIERHRLMATLTYGVGSLAFPYASVFLRFATGTFFTFFTFYLLVKLRRGKKSNWKCFFLAGLTAGFAIICFYFTSLFVLGMFILLPLRKRHILAFILALWLGLSPLLFYNQSIFGNPLELTIQHADPKTGHPMRYFILGVPYFTSPTPFPSLYIILRLLFFPHSGLFFYYPIFVLSLSGFFNMRGRFPTESNLIIFLFIALLCLVSILPDLSFSGIYFGSRPLVLAMPFLTLLLVGAFEKTNLKIILSLLVISILINFASLQNWENPITGRGRYRTWDEFNSFKIFANPIADHYFPLLVRNGPRSRLFESLLKGKIDIRSPQWSSPFLKKNLKLFSVFSLGIVVLKIPFLSLVPLSFLIFIIWKKDLCKIAREFPLNRRWMFFFLSILLLTLFLFFIDVSQTYFRNWHSPLMHDDMEKKWMGQSASIILFNSQNFPIRQMLNFEVKSFYKPRTLEIYLNGNLIERYDIQHTEFITIHAKLYPGENELEFRSVDGCDRPSVTKAWEGDSRCLSFQIGHIEAIRGSKKKM